jgi:hypothetical protein
MIRVTRGNSHGKGVGRKTDFFGSAGRLTKKGNCGEGSGVSEKKSSRKVALVLEG